MIRVFPSKTNWTPIDKLAFVGDPPFPSMQPPTQPVMVSVAFDWDILEGKRLAFVWAQYYPVVKIGGPAFDDPGGEFVPGRFIKQGVTITSRGCPNNCPWCFVPGREGGIRELPIKDGWIIQDNNLLACSRKHIEAVFAMLRKNKKAAVFSGGIDARLLQPWHIELFNSIRFKELLFACDSKPALKTLEQAALILEGIPQHKRRCYVMIGYGDEAMAEAEARCERVLKIGFDPFSQLYRGPGERKYDQAWKNLNRKWSRPAAYKSRNTIARIELSRREGKGRHEIN